MDSFSSLQVIIEQLEHERNTMADAIAEKMREHQHLLRVKMDLGMEVAAYRWWAHLFRQLSNQNKLSSYYHFQ